MASSESESEDEIEELGVESEDGVEEKASGVESESAKKDFFSRFKTQQLAPANPHALDRERAVRTNQPPKGKKRRISNSVKGQPRNSAGKRVAEFPDHSFKAVTLSTLRCLACAENVSTKKSSTKVHIESKKHVEHLARMLNNDKNKEDIISHLKTYDNEVHPKGETLDQTTRVFRLDAVRALLSAGIPLAKLDDLRPFLEKYGHSLTHSSNMSDLVDFIHKKELDDVKKDFKGLLVSVVFDGASRQGEVLAVVIRYVDPKTLTIVQLLVRVAFFKKSLTGDQTARALSDILLRRLGLEVDAVAAGMRDGAAVNNKGMRRLNEDFTSCFDILCCSHTLDRVGRQFNAPLSKKFMKRWNKVFSHSVAAKARFAEEYGQTWIGKSPTRWWSEYEQEAQIIPIWSTLPDFFQQLVQADICVKSCRKLIATLNDPTDKPKLMMEMAVIVDYAEPLVKATYTLEADGAVGLVTYKTIQELRASLQAPALPNATALRTLFSSGAPPAVQQYWSGVIAEIVQPGLDYFTEKIAEMNLQMKAFRGISVFDPWQAVAMSDAELHSRLEDLGVLRFLTNQDKQALRDSLALYKAAVVTATTTPPGLAREPLPAPAATASRSGLPRGAVPTTPFETDYAQASLKPHDRALLFWRKQQAAGDLAPWIVVLRKVLLVQPSSAAAERVFSLLKQSFNHLQGAALNDYVELSLMLQYNDRH